MLNLTHMLRAPMRDYEVTMHRKACLEANQSARKCVAYVRAIDGAEAKRAAEKLPGKSAFKAMSAREIR